jgi:urease accessory protein
VIASGRIAVDGERVELRSDPPLVLRATPGAVYLIGGAAGPLGGDDLTLDVVVADRSHLSVRSGAASYALPSPVPRPSRLASQVAVGAGGRLHWRPEPLVSVAGSEHGIDTDIALASDAALVWWDEMVLGRFGEPGGRLRTRLRVDRAGAPLVRHQLDLGPGAPGWAGPGAQGPVRVVIEVVVVDAPGGPGGEAAAMTTVGERWRAGRLPIAPGAALFVGLGEDRDEVVGALADLGVPPA